jgi:transposase
MRESGQKEGMRGRWELSDAQWQLIEPILRPKRRVDGRGRPGQDTRAVFNGYPVGLGHGGALARAAGEISLISDLP